MASSAAHISPAARRLLGLDDASEVPLGGSSLDGVDLVAKPFAREPPARLLVFGDSWAAGDGCTPAWPEVMAERLGWSTLNFAEGHSCSSGLAEQARSLQRTFALGHPLHDDAWAIIHTGGNDLWFAPTREFAAVAAAGVASAACCWRWEPPALLQGIATNVLELATRLRGMGVRNVAFVGIPLTAQMPLIAKLTGSLERLPVVGAVGGAASARLMAHLNAMHQRALDHARRRFVQIATVGGPPPAQATPPSPRTSGAGPLGVPRRRSPSFSSSPALARTPSMGTIYEKGGKVAAVCLDEASAIDAVIARAPHAKPGEWWHDGSHPSAALHDALAAEMLARIRRGGDDPPLPDAVVRDAEIVRPTPPTSAYFPVPSSD